MQRVILIVCGLSFVTCVLAEKQVLYVGALMELSNHWYENYINFFPTIIEHVFEEIENRTDILADYSLQLITKDTQVILTVNSDFFARVLFARNCEVSEKITRPREMAKSLCCLLT